MVLWLRSVDDQSRTILSCRKDKLAIARVLIPVQPSHLVGGKCLAFGTGLYRALDDINKRTEIPWKVALHFCRRPHFQFSNNQGRMIFQRGSEARECSAENFYGDSILCFERHVSCTQVL